MNDIKNEMQTNVNADYAGPPKAHNFQSNTNTSMPKMQPPPSKIQMPERTPENVLLNEDDVLLKNDDVSTTSAPSIDGTEADNELLKMIKHSEELEARQNKKKVKVKKEPMFDWKKINFSQKWFEFRKKIVKFRKQVIEFRRKYKKAFNMLDILWGTVKFAFYCVGLSFFAFCSFIYFYFEPLVHDYLVKHKLSDISFEKISYSLSELSFKNIKEKNGLFTIGSVKVHYTFADLLEKRIPSVIIDSMKIHIQEEKNGKNTSEKFISTLWNSGLLERNTLFSIQSVRFENSMLYVGNKAYKIPVNFSGVGSFAEKKELEFPITLNNDYISLKATVKMVLGSASSEWKMEIIEGSLAIPGFELQTLKGNATLTTRRGHIMSLAFIGSLTNENIKKPFNVEFIHAGDKRYSMTLTYTIPGKPSMVYTMNASNVAISKDFQSIETKSPIFLKITNIAIKDFKLGAFQISTNGTFKCDANGCMYKMQRGSDVVLFNPSYTNYDTEYAIIYPLRMTLEADKEIAFRYQDKKIDFSFSTNRSVFDLRKKVGNSSPENIAVHMNESYINGSFDLEQSKGVLDLNIPLSKIDSSSLFSSNVSFKGQISDEGLNARLKAGKIRLKTFDYFKPEVKLDMSITPDDYFVASIETSNRQISADINGYYHPYTGEILMALQTKKPIEFKKNLPPPQDISGLFSSNLKDVSGKISVKGQLHYKNNRSISGPLKAKIDNASFTFGNTRIENLNTVLNITQLLPFGAQGIQNIYAKSITSALPLENVHAQVFFDASRKQFNISSLTALIAGYHLTIEPMWYNYGAPIYNFTFKGKTEPIQNIVNQTTLKNLQIKGNGTISVSTQLEEDKMTLKTCELNIPTEGYVEYTPKVYPNPYLENLKHLDFKKLSIYLTEQDENVDLIFSSDNKANKLRRKTNFRFTIKEPLKKYIIPTPYSLPDMLADEKENF